MFQLRIFSITSNSKHIRLLNRALEEWPEPLPPKINMFAVNQNWLNIAKGVHWVQFWRKKLTEQMLIQQRGIICQSWHLLINIIYSISDIQYIQWGSSIDPCLAPYKWKILAWPNWCAWCGHRLDERGTITCFVFVYICICVCAFVYLYNLLP